jgi:enoyl-CoA hydratase/carnithine racemase
MRARAFGISLFSGAKRRLPVHDAEPILRIERLGAVQVLTLNRPHVLNALNAELELALWSALDAAQADPNTRAVVLCGSGRSFSAGADLKERAIEEPPSVDQVIEEFRRHSVFMKVLEMEIPVIAAVHGYCLGGAMQLAGLCDITILGASAKLGEPEVRFANPLLVPITPMLLGAKRARRLLYLGSMIDAAEAFEMGLATEVVADDAVRDRAIEIATDIESVPAGSIAVIARAMRVAEAGRGLGQGTMANVEILALTLETQRAQPGAELFLEAVRRDGAGRAVARDRRGSIQDLREKSGAAMRTQPPGTNGPSLVRLDHRGTASVITLDRPNALNAMNRQLLAEFDAAFEDAVAETSTRAVIIRGEGRAFSAGMDMKEPDLLPLPDDGQRTHLASLLARVMRIWRADKVVIAAVHGHCLGHACDIAAAADFTIAAESALFGVPEVRHLGGVAAMLYPYLMPQKAARDFLYRGRSIDGETARRVGLATSVVADGTLMDAAFALADEVGEIPVAGLRQMKRAINRAYDGMGLEATVALNLESLALILNAQPAADLSARERLISEHGLSPFLSDRDGPRSPTSGGQGA